MDFISREMVSISQEMVSISQETVFISQENFSKFSKIIYFPFGLSYNLSHMRGRCVKFCVLSLSLAVSRSVPASCINGFSFRTALRCVTFFHITGRSRKHRIRRYPLTQRLHAETFCTRHYKTCTQLSEIRHIKLCARTYVTVLSF
jgi:hypothetical protein